MIDDIIAIAIILLLVGGGIYYIVKSKRRGEKCVGCPYSKSCSSRSAFCGCSEKNNASVVDSECEK